MGIKTVICMVNGDSLSILQEASALPYNLQEQGYSLMSLETDENNNFYPQYDNKGLVKSGLSEEDIRRINAQRVSSLMAETLHILGSDEKLKKAEFDRLNSHYLRINNMMLMVKDSPEYTFFLNEFNEIYPFTELKPISELAEMMTYSKENTGNLAFEKVVSAYKRLLYFLHEKDMNLDFYPPLSVLKQGDVCVVVDGNHRFLSAKEYLDETGIDVMVPVLFIEA